MKRIVAFLFCALLLVNLPGLTSAGGYLVVTDTGVPYAWDNSSPIPWNPDLGGLGTLSTNAAAVAYVQGALDQWAVLPSTNLTFANTGNLPIDVQTTSEFFTYYGVYDGLSPVVFDEDGTLFDALFGPGTGVLGFATVEFVTTTAPFEILEAFQCYNGRWIDGNVPNGEFSLPNFAAVITHEFGHALNLDHNQVNGQYWIGDTDDPGFALYGPPPVGSAQMMFPFLFGDPYDALTPLSDDEAWIAALYPSGGVSFATISGSVYRTDGVTPHQGANVIARNPADPFYDAVANVSGYLYNPGFGYPGGPTPAALEGSYDLPGLTPGTNYTVEMVQVNPNFTGGSGVGPVDPPAALGTEEFYNGANEGPVDPPDVPSDYTAVLSGASGIDLVINGVLDTNEPNDTPGNCTALAYGNVGSGTIDPAGDMDWFCFSGNAGDLIAGEVVAYRNATGLDPTLTLVDSDGSTVLAFNDDTFSLDSQIVTCLPGTGTFYLVVQGYGGFSTGAFDLHLDYLGMGDVEPNDDAAHAIPLDNSCPASALGCVSPPGDTDFYAFVVGGPQTLQLNMNTQDIYGSPDAYLRLYDTDGTTVLAQDDDGGPGYDSQITYNFTAAGTYYVEVLTSPTYDPNGTGLYEVTLGGATLVTHGNGHDIDATAGGNSGWSNYAPAALGFADHAFDGHYGITDGVSVDDGDDADFEGTCIQLFDPGSSKDEVTASLGDENSPVTLSGGATGLEIDQFTYHNDLRGNGDSANWTLVQTVVRNTTGSPQGVRWYKHLDLDIDGTYSDDEGGWDASRNLAYQYDGSGSHVGITLLSGSLIGYQINDFAAAEAPDNTGGSGETARADFMAGNNLGDLSTPGPGDRNVSLAADLGVLQPGESAILWWAVVGGTSLADMQADADDALQCVPLYCELDLDPGKCPNTFKLWNKGNTFACIVGSPDFDVNQIDAASVRLEGVKPKDTFVLDMTSVGGGEGCTDCPPGHTQNDGIADLRLKMRTKEMHAAMDPVTQGEIRTMTATGKMLNGRPFIATGCAAMDVNSGGNNTGGGHTLVSFTSSPASNTQHLGFSDAVNTPVTIRVYAVTGRLVHTLAEGVTLTGGQELSWDTSGVPNGIYFYKIEVNDQVITKKILLAR